MKVSDLLKRGLVIMLIALLMIGFSVSAETFPGNEAGISHGAVTKECNVKAYFYADTGVHTYFSATTSYMGKPITMKGSCTEYDAQNLYDSQGRHSMVKKTQSDLRTKIAYLAETSGKYSLTPKTNPRYRYIVCAALCMANYRYGATKYNHKSAGSYERQNGDKEQIQKLFDQAKALDAAPDNFECFYVNLKGGDQQDMVFWSLHPAYGYIKITKSSTVPAYADTYSLKGAQYTIYKGWSTSGAQADVLTIGSREKSGKLSVGKYCVKETRSPTNGKYNKDKKLYKVTVKKNVTIVVKSKDAPKMGGLKVEKQSADPAYTTGNVYSLKGAEYTVYDSNGNQVTGMMVQDGDKAGIPVDVLTTDEDGESETVAMKYGNYTVKETKAPEAYELDETVHEVSILEGADITEPVVVNSIEKFLSSPLEFMLEKKGDRTFWYDDIPSRAGAIFEVRYYDGYYTAEDIEAGSKTGTTAGEDTDESYEDKDSDVDSELGDGDGDLGEEEAGDVAEEESSPASIIRTWRFVTDENGRISYDVAHLLSGSDDLYRTSDGTPAARLGTYTFQEITAPPGYLINYNIITTQLRPDGMTPKGVVYNNGNPVIQPEAFQLVNIHIEKKDAETGGSVAQGYGTLQGAEFSIEKLRDGTKDTWEKAGNVTTDANGYGVLENQLPGAYRIIETKAPSGYGINHEIIYKNCPRNDDYTAYFDYTATAYDHVTTLHVSKVSFTGEEELSGAHLTLFDSAGKVVESWISTGTAHIIKGLATGTYRLHEDLAPLGYATAGDVEVNVGNGNPDQYVTMTDKVIRVDISKEDLSTGEPVVGAELQIKDSNGEVVRRWITGKEPTRIEKLPVGEYTLTEILAPDGYMTAADLKFTVLDTGEIQKVTMKDERVTPHLSKTDSIKGEAELYNSPGPQTVTRTPKTGDNSKLILYAILFAAALVALAAVLHQRKKIRKED